MSTIQFSLWCSWQCLLVFIFIFPLLVFHLLRNWIESLLSFLQLPLTWTRWIVAVQKGGGGQGESGRKPRLRVLLSALVAFTLSLPGAQATLACIQLLSHTKLPPRKVSTPVRLRGRPSAPTPHHKTGCYHSLNDTPSLDRPWPVATVVLHTRTRTPDLQQGNHPFPS